MIVLKAIVRTAEIVADAADVPAAVDVIADAADAVAVPVAADAIADAAVQAGEGTKKFLPRIHTDIKRATAKVVAFFLTQQSSRWRRP